MDERKIYAVYWEPWNKVLTLEEAVVVKATKRFLWLEPRAGLAFGCRSRVEPGDYAESAPEALCRYVERTAEKVGLAEDALEEARDANALALVFQAQHK